MCPCCDYPLKFGISCTSLETIHLFCEHRRMNCSWKPMTMFVSSTYCVLSSIQAVLSLENGPDPQAGIFLHSQSILKTGIVCRGVELARLWCRAGYVLAKACGTSDPKNHRWASKANFWCQSCGKGLGFAGLQCLMRLLVQLTSRKSSGFWKMPFEVNFMLCSNLKATGMSDWIVHITRRPRRLFLCSTLQITVLTKEFIKVQFWDFFSSALERLCVYKTGLWAMWRYQVWLHGPVWLSLRPVLKGELSCSGYN